MTDESKKLRFEEIRKGDTIRTEHEEYGAVYFVSGVADHPNSTENPSAWITKAGGILVRKGFGYSPQIFLVNRPELYPPGTAGSASVRDSENRVRMIRMTENSSGFVWVDERGHHHTEDEVTNFK